MRTQLAHDSERGQRAPDWNHDDWSGGSWIWGASAQADQYRCFRKRFRLGAVPGGMASVAISADSDFVLFLNGKELGRGQFSDLRGRKTWTVFPAGEALRRGENVLAVLVFYRGEDFMDYEVSGAGLLAVLKVEEKVVPTDGSWLTALHPAFRQGMRTRMTPQTGFTFHYDARREQPWLEVVYDDTGWERARVVQSEPTGALFGSLEPRPLPALVPGAWPSVRVCGQGVVVTKGCRGSVAQRMSLAARRAEFPWDVFANRELCPSFGGADSFAGLSLQESGNYTGSRPNAGVFLEPGADEPLILRERMGVDGRYLVLDLGEEMTGLLEWEVEAAEGMVLHVAHGEHLAEGRVRARVGGRNFADSYVCGAGRNRFQMPFRRVGGRYLEIHVHGGQELRFYAAGLRRVEYPAERRGAFACADGLVNRVHEVAVRTLELCRHEHYEDCPWREQALYAYDARLQALYGYYAFGDYRFPEVSLSLLGRTLDGRGLLALTAPGKWPLTIPVFSFTWVVALGEHWMHSGEGTLFGEFRETVESILNKAGERLDPQTGLYHLPTGEGIWHFYEWTPGLSGMGDDAPQGGEYHAAYNLHLHEALRWFAWMLEQSGEQPASARVAREVRALGRAIHQRFWDAGRQCYRARCSREGIFYDDSCYEIVQAMALHEGIGGRTSARQVVNTLLSGATAPCTLSGLYYLVGPLVDYSFKAGHWLNERLERLWQGMVLRGATTLWETVEGEGDFDFAGSLCHGWSALPVYYHQACVLGVRPIQPGFRTFRVQPTKASLSGCRGRVPTPSGLIEVSWAGQGAARRIEVRAPKGCQREE